jgi:hypothetical protein
LMVKYFIVGEWLFEEELFEWRGFWDVLGRWDCLFLVMSFGLVEEVELRVMLVLWWFHYQDVRVALAMICRLDCWELNSLIYKVLRWLVFLWLFLVNNIIILNFNLFCGNFLNLSVTGLVFKSIAFLKLFLLFIWDLVVFVL